MNPFKYDFNRPLEFKSVADQRHAGYREAQPTDYHANGIADLYKQDFGVSPNIDTICSIECPEGVEPSDEPSC